MMVEPVSCCSSIFSIWWQLEIPETPPNSKLKQLKWLSAVFISQLWKAFTGRGSSLLVCFAFCLPQMLLSWCGLRSCTRGSSVWRSISSTQPWCSTPLQQKLEVWARTIKSWTSSKALLGLSAEYFTSICILVFSISSPWGYVFGTTEHKVNR